MVFRFLQLKQGVFDIPLSLIRLANEGFRNWKALLITKWQWLFTKVKVLSLFWHGSSLQAYPTFLREWLPAG